MKQNDRRVPLFFCFDRHGNNFGCVDSLLTFTCFFPVLHFHPLVQAARVDHRSSRKSSSCSGSPPRPPSRARARAARPAMPTWAAARTTSPRVRARAPAAWEPLVRVAKEANADRIEIERKKKKKKRRDEVLHRKRPDCAKAYDSFQKFTMLCPFFRVCLCACGCN